MMIFDCVEPNNARFDSYGWIYPTSEYNYFEFASIKSWAILPILFWSIYYFFLLPKKINIWLGFFINGTAGYITEFIVGYVSSVIFHETMQYWPNSRFAFVGGLGCYLLWQFDAMLYYLLVFKMPNILIKSLESYSENTKSVSSGGSTAKVHQVNH